MCHFYLISSSVGASVSIPLCFLFLRFGNISSENFVVDIFDFLDFLNNFMIVFLVQAPNESWLCKGFTCQPTRWSHTNFFVVCLSIESLHVLIPKQVLPLMLFLSRFEAIWQTWTNLDLQQTVRHYGYRFGLFQSRELLLF